MNSTPFLLETVAAQQAARAAEDARHAWARRTPDRAARTPRLWRHPRLPRLARLARLLNAKPAAPETRRAFTHAVGR